jgi:hypothetical protein
VALPTAALVDCELPIATWGDISPGTRGVLRRQFSPKDD